MHLQMFRLCPLWLVLLLAFLLYNFCFLVFVIWQLSSSDLFNDLSMQGACNIKKIVTHKSCLCQQVWWGLFFFLPTKYAVVISCWNLYLFNSTITSLVCLCLVWSAAKWIQTCSCLILFIIMLLMFFLWEHD